MLCGDCKEQPAAVHVTQIINGQKTELHLCQHCANRRGLQFFLPSAAPSVFKPAFQPPQPPQPGEKRVCDNCGYSWHDFLASGFLGCTKCYASFGDLLPQLIARNYGNVKHQGKIPVKGAGPMKIRREIMALRAELDKAVQEENFERAAEVRDQIRALEQRI